VLWLCSASRVRLLPWAHRQRAAREYPANASGQTLRSLGVERRAIFKPKSSHLPVSISLMHCGSPSSCRTGAPQHPRVHRIGQCARRRSRQGSGLDPDFAEEGIRISATASRVTRRRGNSPRPKRHCRCRRGHTVRETLEQVKAAQSEIKVGVSVATINMPSGC